MPAAPCIQPTGRGWSGLLLILIAIGLALALGWQGRGLITRWRADRTAREFARALYHADSVRLTKLSRRGSTRNLLCARYLWPAAFWMRRDGRPLLPVRTRPSRGAYGYATVGESLPGGLGPAVFEFSIAPADPGKIVSFFADARTGVWNDTVWACMQP